MTEIKTQNKPSRELIEEFEKLLETGEKLEIVTTHYLCDGMYARSIFIPKGAIIVGKIHSTEHLNIVSKGRIRVLTEEGLIEVGAGYHVVSFPNCKKVGEALEDTIWTTIHPNRDNIKDIDKLEEILVKPSYELEGGIEKCL